MITLVLSEREAKALFEIINITGVELTELDTDYGSDTIESLAQDQCDSESCEGVNVTRTAHKIFNFLRTEGIR